MISMNRPKRVVPVILGAQRILDFFSPRNGANPCRGASDIHAPNPANSLFNSMVGRSKEGLR